MQIEHGPPGSIGVKQLAYMGDFSSDLSSLTRPIAAVALGTVGYAWITENRKLRTQAGAVALGAVIAGFILR